MKFDDPVRLHEEIQSAYLTQKRAQDVRCTILESVEAQTYGATGAAVPENRGYTYVSRMTPKCVSGNPECAVSNAGDARDRASAAMMTAALNEWIVRTNHARLLERMVPYALTGWGMTLTTLEKIKGFADNEDDVTNPNVVILDPSDVTWDPYAQTFDAKRWCSHKYARDKDSLIEYAKANPKEGWDVAAIEECAVDVGLDELSRGKHAKGVPKRQEIVLQDVWCAGEDGSSGHLYTLGMRHNGTGTFLREMREFYGPRTGPYNLFGIYNVPCRSIPMSPLGAVWPTIQELNAYALVIADSARKGKSVGVTNLGQSVATSVLNARDFDTINVGAVKLEEAFHVIEFGYITKERVEYYNMLSDRVDRMLMDDANMGKVTGIGTATEVATAATATNEITGYVAQRFEECAEALLGTVLWYLYHEPTVVMNLPVSDADRTKMEKQVGRPVDSLRYTGGPDEDGHLAPFDGFTLRINQYSMQKMSEAKMRQRSTDLIQLLPQLTLLPQLASSVDVESYVSEIGKGIDIPDLGDLVSGDKAAALAQQAAQAEADPAAPQSAQTQPTSMVRVPGAAA